MEPRHSSVSRNWKHLYEAAVLELNAEKALQRIDEAASAIRLRIEDVSRSGDSLEAEQLLNAFNALLDLRTVVTRER